MSVPFRKILIGFFVFGLDRAVDWKMSNPPIWLSSSLIGVLTVIGLLIFIDFARQWHGLPFKTHIERLFDSYAIWGSVFIASVFAVAFVIAWPRQLTVSQKNSLVPNDDVISIVQEEIRYACAPKKGLSPEVLADWQSEALYSIPEATCLWYGHEPRSVLRGKFLELELPDPRMERRYVRIVEKLYRCESSTLPVMIPSSNARAESVSCPLSSEFKSQIHHWPVARDVLLQWAKDTEQTIPLFLQDTNE